MITSRSCGKREDKEISTAEFKEERHQHHNFTLTEKKYNGSKARLNDLYEDLEKDVTLSFTVDYEDVKKDDETFRFKLETTVDVSFDKAVQKLGHKQTESRLELQDVAKESIEKVETKIQKIDLDLIDVHPSLPSTSPLTYSITSYRSPMSVPDKDVISTTSSCTSKIGNENIKDEVKNGEEIVRIPCFDTKSITSFWAEIHGCSIVPAGNSTAWISRGDSERIYLYDMSGKVVKSMTLRGSRGIYNIALKGAGDLIITCRDRRVRHVTMTGKITVLIDTDPFFPKGVCLTDNEDIVVCMAGQGNNAHVATYSSDGQNKICHIVAKDNNDKLVFSDPYRVVFNGEYVTVLNLERNVVNIDQSGNVTWVYDGSQAMLSEAFTPCGICMDKYCVILISDNLNHCVHFLNREGGLLKIINLQDKGIYFPWGICTSRETGDLWLGSVATQTIWIFPYSEK